MGEHRHSAPCFNLIFDVWLSRCYLCRAMCLNLIIELAFQCLYPRLHGKPEIKTLEMLCGRLCVCLSIDLASPGLHFVFFSITDPS